MPISKLTSAQHVTNPGAALISSSLAPAATARRLWLARMSRRMRRYSLRWIGRGDDPEWGQRLAAVVVLAPGTSLALEELRAWAKQRLAEYKIPSPLHVVGHLPPRNATGEVMQSEVANNSHFRSGALQVAASTRLSPTRPGTSVGLYGWWRRRKSHCRGRNSLGGSSFGAAKIPRCARSSFVSTTGDAWLFSTRLGRTSRANFASASFPSGGVLL